jgi:hypothetical protein
MPLRVDAGEGDPELLSKRQQVLAALGQRTMSQAVGRGALTLAAVAPLPTEPLEVPTLCLSGQLPEQHHANVSLDLATAQAAPGEAGVSCCVLCRLLTFWLVGCAVFAVLACCPFIRWHYWHGSRCRYITAIDVIALLLLIASLPCACRRWRRSRCHSLAGVPQRRGRRAAAVAGQHHAADAHLDRVQQAAGAYLQQRGRAAGAGTAGWASPADFYCLFAHRMHGQACVHGLWLGAVNGVSIAAACCTLAALGHSMCRALHPPGPGCAPQQLHHPCACSLV